VWDHLQKFPQMHVTKLLMVSDKAFHAGRSVHDFIFRSIFLSSFHSVAPALLSLHSLHRTQRQLILPRKHLMEAN
jgi:hypothetical protein